MVIASHFDTLTYHPKRQSPPIRVGVNPPSPPNPNNTTSYIITAVFAVFAVVVCSITVFLWLRYRRKVTYKTSKFNQESGQAWKLDDQLPQNPTPSGDAKPAYGGKGGHDAGPEQEQGLLANAAGPGHTPGPSNDLPHSHSHTSFHSDTSTLGRYSYDSKGQRLSTSHDPNCPVHSSHPGQPCPVHSQQNRPSTSGLRPSSYMPPPASTYNTAAAPPTNPNFYAAELAQAQQGRPQSTPTVHSPPPDYMSRPGTAQPGQSSSDAGPPAALVPGPPTTPRPQHQFSNPYNHNRRPSATNQLLPLYLANTAGGGGQADSYFDTNMPLETPVVMQAESALVQRPRELSVDGRGRVRERERSADGGEWAAALRGHERGLSVDTVVPLTPGGGRNRDRRLSIGVPVIARTRSGRRQQSVDTGRRTPMWTDERGRLSVLQVEGVGRERQRGRSVSPRRSLDMDAGDVGDSLLGQQYRAWGQEQVRR